MLWCVLNAVVCTKLDSQQIKGNTVHNCKSKENMHMYVYVQINLISHFITSETFLQYVTSHQDHFNVVKQKYQQDQWLSRCTQSCTWLDFH